MIPAMSHCTEVIREEGESAGFALFAGATSNYVSTGFYIVQVLLSLLLLLQRRDKCGGKGDGDWCGDAQYKEPLPIRPLHPRSPGDDGLSTSLLGSAPLVATSARGVEAPMPAAVPLRFWIALTLSATVVGFLATMGSLYGVFLTDLLRAWTTQTNAQIVQVSNPHLIPTSSSPPPRLRLTSSSPHIITGPRVSRTAAVSSHANRPSPVIHGSMYQQACLVHTQSGRCW